MKEYALELGGMTCGACERIIEKTVKENGATVKEIDARRGLVRFVAEQDKLGAIKQQLAEKGFRENMQGRGDPSRIITYISSIVTGEKQVNAEAALARYALASIGIIGLLGVAVLSASGPAYAPMLALAALGSVLISFSYHHMGCYRKRMSCANGMMVGMTVGMIAGFMTGALLGATNGMFIGSVAGIVAGVAIGGELGRSSGIMGAMEGVMAGLMAGVMGAMTSVMMINDNLLLFLGIFFSICAATLGGLSYMMHREECPAELKAGFLHFLGASFALTVLMAAIMLFGPKNGLVYPQV